MTGPLPHLSRRSFISRAMAAIAAAGLLPPSVIRAAAPAQTDLRFRALPLPKADIAAQLLQLRSSNAAISQLVLEGEHGCLILAGERSTTGAQRLEL